MVSDDVSGVLRPKHGPVPSRFSATNPPRAADGNSCYFAGGQNALIFSSVLSTRTCPPSGPTRLLWITAL